MKSSGKGGPPAFSHIPLPRRKSSCKGMEVNDTDSEAGSDFRGHTTKMSLLAGSSFCCTSAQKEDYEPRILPRKKISASRQIQDASAPITPLLPPSKVMLRNRKKIIECPAEDTLSQSSELGLRKPSHEDIKLHSSADSRLRPPDQKGKMTPSSPQRKLSRDPLPFQKEIIESKATSQITKKLRKISSPSLPSKCIGGKRSREEHAVAESKHHSPKKEPAQIHADGISNCTGTSGNSELALRFSDPFHQSNNMLNNSDVKVLSDKKCNVIVKKQFQEPIEEKYMDKVLPDKAMPREPMDSSSPVNDSVLVLQMSHRSDDFDCPCCDRVSPFDVFPNECNKLAEADAKQASEKELELQAQVLSLQEDLEVERQRLKTKTDRVLSLEEDLNSMEMLKSELQKEKELRKIAEDKLLEVLDHEKKMEALRKENEKRMESRGTQKDDPDLNSSENSPVIMGYESRVRRYQSYIQKLEKDNHTLVNELKKIKEMSQGERLLEKLSEVQRCSQQQQLQYESCMDEVAGRLVQTLLVQKRLEEECKVLHLRVEQLEQENGTLMEMCLDEKKENISKVSKVEQGGKTDPMYSKVQSKQASHHVIAPLVINKKSSNPPEDKAEKPLKSPNSCSPKDKTSPLSPLSKANSKIPAFHSPKSPEIQSTKSKHAKDSYMRGKSVSQKGTSAKRKRLSRNSSPVEHKQRLKNSHSRWESKRTLSEGQTSYCKPSKDELPSSLQDFDNHQHIWSLSCELNSDLPFPENYRKVTDSLDNFSENLCDNSKKADDLEIANKEIFQPEEVPGGANRTRDEGYSTMSSDLQPDSTPETGVNTQENSVPFMTAEKDLRCVSDDSVTECLDGSMCSSSDSGFGPLHLVANSNSSDLRKYTRDAQKLSSENVSTVRHKEQIASVKPIVRNTSSQITGKEQTDSCKKPNNLDCDNLITTDPTFKPCNRVSSPLKSTKTIFEQLDGPLQSSTPLHPPKFDYASMLDYWTCARDILDITSHGNTWHFAGTKKANAADKIVFCTRNSYIDDNMFQEKIQTAEKATLTEPEEEMWREKTLAPFIDESIWSLYSSEGDIQVKHFPVEPLLSEPSLDNLIVECNPCIVVTEDTNPPDSSIPESQSIPSVNLKFGLERVASDTVLYLKDAICELEDSMHRGLKSSKNVSSLQNSGSESEASPPALKPELLLNLERVMKGERHHLMWPSPTKTSSTSSLQSSVSCQAMSDETDDLDNLRTSRRGSLDPELSSSSEVECENLEHKDFVENWLQNEVGQTCAKAKEHPQSVVNVKKPVPVRRKASLPSTPNVLSPRPRFMSFPQGSSPYRKTQAQPSAQISITNGQMIGSKSCNDSMEEVDFGSVELEVKEFNENFYKLCSVSSQKSLDHVSPAKAQDAQNDRLSTISVNSNNKTLSSDSPPTGKEKPSKPTVLVKPTRPVTLVVNSISETYKEPVSSSYCTNFRDVSSSDQKVESVEVPVNDYLPVLPCKNPLPSTTVSPKTGYQRTKTNSPTKIGVKCNSSSKKQHFKKDNINARRSRLKEGCGTAWIHLPPNPEFNDPKSRMNLLNSMRSPTSSSGSSSEEEEAPIVVQTSSHLQRICQERRHKVKASAHNPLFESNKRSSIVGRRELFYRFGEKEKEAIACFDFLEELPASSAEAFASRIQHSSTTKHHALVPPSSFNPSCHEEPSKTELDLYLSPSSFHKEIHSPFYHRKTRVHDHWSADNSAFSSLDSEFQDHISLSDSCAESFSSTPDSHEEAS